MVNGNESVFGMNRRTFLQSAAAAGVGLALSPLAFSQDAKKEKLNIALIGPGKQGSILLSHLLKMEDIQIKAIADIWSYTSKRAAGMCRQLEPAPTMYTDYREMIEKEKDLHGVIIATADFIHHKITNDCLEAGLNVYCEKEMSNDIEKARSMVKTAEKTGKLLQIGHQRHSNPFYNHSYTLMNKEGFFGDILSVSGQWNQRKPIALAKINSKLEAMYPLDPAVMKEWGYENMQEFYEWRWFNKYAGGPMTDLGSHQVDVFIWFLGATPSSVMAFGDNDFSTKEAKELGLSFAPECFDYTKTFYEFKTKTGLVSGYYQVDLRTSLGGFFEEFMGSKGAMRISEIKEKNLMQRERTVEAEEWQDQAAMVDKGGGEQGMAFDPMASRKAKGKMSAEDLKQFEAELAKPAHWWHLENFFDAIRDKSVKLTCPPEVAFETAVAVLKANESAVTGKRIELKPEDFKA